MDLMIQILLVSKNHKNINIIRKNYTVVFFSWSSGRRELILQYLGAEDMWSR